MPRWEVRTFINSLGTRKANTIIATGIDLAKIIFAVGGVNVRAWVVQGQPEVARFKLGVTIAAPPSGVVKVKACLGAHCWDRQFQTLGRTVRLMTPNLLTPNRKTGKCGKSRAVVLISLSITDHHCAVSRTPCAGRRKAKFQFPPPRQ